MERYIKWIYCRSKYTRLAIVNTSLIGTNSLYYPSLREILYPNYKLHHVHRLKHYRSNSIVRQSLFSFRDHEIRNEYTERDEKRRRKQNTWEKKRGLEERKRNILQCSFFASLCFGARDTHVCTSISTSTEQIYHCYGLEYFSSTGNNARTILSR